MASSYSSAEALIVDFGCGTTKIGMAGGDVPACVMPGVVGVPAGGGGGGGGGGGEGSGVPSSHEDSGWWARRGRVGERYLPCPTECVRSNVAYRPLLDPSEGLLKDWDGALAQLEWAVGNRLGVGKGRGAGAPLDMSAHPVLLVEQAYTSKADREKWAQILFEEYNVPGVFMSRAGVLALYANARVTGLSVDIGAGGTTITPVQEGYPLMGALRRSPVGGRVLDGALLSAAYAQGTALHPRLPSAKPRSSSSSSSSSASGGGGLAAAAAALHSTVRTFHTLELARDARESLCRVYEGGAFESAAHAHVPIVSYDLPDGTKLSLGPQRYAVCELLMDPSPLQEGGGSSSSSSSSGMGGGSGDNEFAGCQGIPDMIQAAIMACEIECRRDLCMNISLTGGGAATEGLSERILKEMLGRQEDMNCRAKLCAASNAERAMGPWLGGSILGSLGTFPDLWFSKSEYDEWGAKMLHRKVL
jgi:actin-related protein